MNFAERAATNFAERAATVKIAVLR